MKPIYEISPDFLNPLNRYKDWVFAPATQEKILRMGIPRAGEAPLPGQASELASLERLLQIDFDKHSGAPGQQLGVNLNYRGNIETRSHLIEPTFFDEIRAKNNELDDELQAVLGARNCALKMYYPAGGYIGWHTNWDLPGYNIIFTYSPDGNGFWRHVDPAGATSIAPRPEKLVHLQDRPGWHCKVGKFGAKAEANEIVWHAAYTDSPRLTVSYVIYERRIWENMVAELEAGL